MAKSTDTQWIPSGSVLAVAIAAALVAAILVNIYIGYVKSDYEAGGKEFYQLRERVSKGDKILPRNVNKITIPEVLVKAFTSAGIVSADASATTVINEKAPRDMAAGEFLFWSDFKKTESLDIPLRRGYELMTIRVSPDSDMGLMLQVGGYINIRGRFDLSSDPKNPNIEPLYVMKNVQVKSINGSREPRSEKSRTPDTIQIEIPGTQVKQMDSVQILLKSKGFLINAVAQPDVTSEPTFEPDILAYLRRQSMGKAPPPTTLPSGKIAPSVTPDTPPAAVTPPVTPAPTTTPAPTPVPAVTPTSTGGSIDGL
jgi:hypothetical protein